MIATILWDLFIGSMLLSVAVCAVLAWFRFPDRTIDDVVDYLRPVDLQTGEMLLDPAADFSYRTFLSPAEFRRIQVKRIHLYIELLRRMSHNAAVLIDLANTESQQFNPVTAKAALALQQEATVVRVQCWITTIQLHCWLLFRLWSPYPFRRHFCLSQLGQCNGTSALDSYRRLASAATDLFQLLPSSRLDDLVHSL